MELPCLPRPGTCSMDYDLFYTAYSKAAVPEFSREL